MFYLLDLMFIRRFFFITYEEEKKEMTLLYLMIATLLYLMIATLLYIMIATHMGYLWSCDINIAKLRKISRMQIMRMETTNKQERMSFGKQCISVWGDLYNELWQWKSLVILVWRPGQLINSKGFYLSLYSILHMTLLRFTTRTLVVFHVVFFYNSFVAILSNATALKKVSQINERSLTYIGFNVECDLGL